jgi:signal transduction histidine kinase
MWKRFERVSHAAIRITAEHDLAKVLQEIVDSAQQVIEARYAALGVLDESGSALGSFMVAGIDDAARARIGDPPRGKGVLGILIKEPRPLRIKNLNEHGAAHGFPAHHPRMTSFLGVPIIGRTGVIGNLYLTDKQGAEEFSDEDEWYAVMLAAHAAVAVDNARYDSERERLMADLKAMHVSRERFFSMINHELRNALTAVYGWADLWIRREGEDPPRAAREVHESAERTLVLLDDLLDISRVDADRLRMHIQEVDAWEIVREAISMVEPAAQRKGLEIRRSGPEGRIMCRTDPQRVRQILINLLTNAVRHSPEDAVVHVKVAATPSTMTFDVVDSGEGIAPEQQVVIFEAFERAGKQVERGTGLGLALSRKLARLLGGDLGVESQVHQGARFTLRLPLEANS